MNKADKKKQIGNWEKRLEHAKAVDDKAGIKKIEQWISMLEEIQTK